MADQDDLTKEAISALKAKDLKQAEICSRAALRIKPDDSDSLYVLGEVHFDRGDSFETVRLLKQAIYCNPLFYRGYRNLANVYYVLGRIRDAAQTYCKWSELDPRNPEPRHMVAATSGVEAPTRCAEDYVATHFDKFAASFDDILVKELRYQGPQIVVTALAGHVGSPSSQLDVLDAGCGTGLCGQQIHPWCRRLVGVDLSKEMLQQARKRQIYTELIESDLCKFMESRPGAFDAVVAADVLIYFGALEPVMFSVTRTLRPHGLFAASAEALLDDDRVSYRLEVHGRYSHHETYIRRALAENGLELLQLNREVIRWELGKKVVGYGFVARKRPAHCDGG